VAGAIDGGVAVSMLTDAPPAAQVLAIHEGRMLETIKDGLSATA
jgi:hypothetical protein